MDGVTIKIDGFNLEDASVISFRQKKNKDAVMKVVMGSEMDETYRKFTFKEADIIEYDDTLKFGFNYYPHGKFTRCNYLFTEIYKYKNSVLGILDAVSADYDNLNLDAQSIKDTLADENNLRLLKDVITKLG